MAEDWFRRQVEGLYKWLIPKGEWTLVMLGMIGIALLGAWAYLELTKPTSPSPSRGGGTRTVIAVEEDKETVSRVFARAPYFKVVEDGRVVEVVRNPYVNAVPAGPPAAKLVASYSPDVVVAGSVGPLARKELEDRGIRVELR